MDQFGFGSLSDEAVCRVDKLRMPVDGGMWRRKATAAAEIGRRRRSWKVEPHETAEMEIEGAEREMRDEIAGKDRPRQRIAIVLGKTLR